MHLNPLYVVYKLQHLHIEPEQQDYMLQHISDQIARQERSRS